MNTLGLFAFKAKRQRYQVRITCRHFTRLPDGAMPLAGEDQRQCEHDFISGRLTPLPLPPEALAQRFVASTAAF